MSTSSQSTHFKVIKPAYWMAAICMVFAAAAPLHADEISACADSIKLVNSRDKDFRCNHALNDRQSYCAVDILLAVRGGCSKDLTVMATVECEGAIVLKDEKTLLARDAALVELGQGGAAGMGEIDLLWPMDTFPDPDEMPQLVNTSCKIIDRNVYPY